MNILYIITILAIYILLILMHKTEKKQNIIVWMAISTILILCYNILICLICTFLGLLCTLGNLTICNTIITITLLSIIIKTKKIQKYYVKISDIIFSISILILVIFIACKQYGFPFNIKYEITDGSTHYFFAEQFYKNSTLLYNERTDDILGLYNSDFRLPGAYINEGILFQVFDEIVAKIDIFILFDLFILYLSGILFYYLLKPYAKENKKIKFGVAIFSIIYMLGYQLNSMLYGYVYLSLALTIVISFLLIMENYEKENISKTKALPILSLISLGIFFSYAYFIPIIYIAIIAYIVIKNIKSKEKIISSSNIIEVMYLIIIPLLLGTAYFIIFPLVNGAKTEISTIGTEGAIYENFITNYIYMIPIFITSIILTIKNKKPKTEIDYSTILFILSIIFAIILFIGNKIGIVSEYYFFKSYYIIWPLAIYNTFKALTNILEQQNKALKITTYIYVVIYILIIICTLIIEKNIWINDIFYTNAKCIRNETYILKREEINLINKMNINEEQLYILSPNYRGRANWISVLYNNQIMYIDWMTGYVIKIDNWLAEKQEKYYLAYHEDYREIEEQEEYLNENSEQYKILYNNEYVFILEKK